MNNKSSLSTDKIQLSCGQAKPGQKLASLGKAMGPFCQEFNKRTASQPHGKIVSVKIKFSRDGNYQFDVKGTPTYQQIKEVIGEKKIITQQELETIAKQQLPFLNTENLEQAKKTIAGTAKSAGISIEN